VMVNFDFANPDMPSGRRHETTVPQQALFLMNSPLVVEQAKKLVTLADFNKCESEESKIDFLYQRVYQRPPTPDEVKLGIEFVTEKPGTEIAATTVQQVSNDTDARKKMREKQGKKRPARAPNEFKKREPLKIWEEYTHALLQANEASFVN
jgi:Protein of unknown function (DUF1553)